MPKHAQDQARIVSVRLPADLLQRLDRVLDWQATARQRPATRNAAIREALRTWLDDHEQRAGLVEPHRLWQQFQTGPPGASNRKFTVSPFGGRYSTLKQ